MTGRVRRILVVEDYAPSSRAMAAILQMEGHAVEIALDAPEALERLATFEADVALVDVRLPSMSGVDLVRRARGLRPALHCILITGLELGAEELAGAGAAGYLRKPIDAEALLRQIDALP